MSTPPDKPKVRINPLLDDEEFRTVSKPVEARVMPAFVEKHLRAAEQKRVSAADEPPPPTRWPMLVGILTFPFYLNTLAAWMFITLGLMAFGWLLMFWIQYGAIGGMSVVYYIGLMTCTVGMLTLGYAASCCLAIIEETSNGWDTFEVSAGMEWKEWIWNFAYFATLLLQAGMVGYLAQYISQLGGLSDSWLPMIVGTYAAFPLVLLGALVADGAWAPTAIMTVLRSIVQVWWAWSLFYLETGAMVLGWVLLTAAGLSREPWPVPLYAAPLLAAIILIYARLTGRLALCIAAKTTRFLPEGDDDEKP